MSNLRAPLGCASLTETFLTEAYDGPWRHHSAIASTASSSPSTWAATEPSGSLRTQPVTPSRSASCTAYHRNATPWTRPVTRTVTALVMTASLRSTRGPGDDHERHVARPHPPRHLRPRQDPAHAGGLPRA